MADQFDVSLEDGELLDEVELTASLMVAANRSERHLTEREVDEALGVLGRREGDEARGPDVVHD